MNLSTTTSAETAMRQAADLGATRPSNEQLEAREVFQQFVAGTFYKEMLKSMRSTLGTPAYFHGGSAEKIFQGQMDQQIAEDLATRKGNSFADSLYDLFALQLKAKTISPNRENDPGTTTPSDKAGAQLDARV